MYHYDAQRLELKPAFFADVHSLEAQRFYNVLCIAYGSNPKLFADVVNKDYLPQDRAEGCEEEFKRVRYAIRTSFRPYISISSSRAKRAPLIGSPGRRTAGSDLLTAGAVPGSHDAARSRWSPHYALLEGLQRANSYALRKTT
jgi:putative metallopeptidase DUF4344